MPTSKVGRNPGWLPGSWANLVRVFYSRALESFAGAGWGWSWESPLGSLRAFAVPRPPASGEEARLPLAAAPPAKPPDAAAANRIVGWKGRPRGL